MVIVMTIAAVGWPTNRVFTGWAAAHAVVGAIVIVAASLANLSGPKRTCRKGAHAKAGASSVAVAAMGRLSATGAIGVRTIIAHLARIGTGGTIATNRTVIFWVWNRSAILITRPASGCEPIITSLAVFNDAIAAGRGFTNILTVGNRRTITAIAILRHGIHKRCGRRGGTLMRIATPALSIAKIITVVAGPSRITRIVIDTTIEAGFAKNFAVLCTVWRTLLHTISISPPIMPATARQTITMAGAIISNRQLPTSIETGFDASVARTFTAIGAAAVAGIDTITIRVNALATNATICHLIKIVRALRTGKILATPFLGFRILRQILALATHCRFLIRTTNCI